MLVLYYFLNLRVFHKAFKVCQNVSTLGAPNFGNCRMVDIVVNDAEEATASEPILTGLGARFLPIGRGGFLSFFVLRFQLTD